MIRYSVVMFLISFTFFPSVSFTQEPKLILPIGHTLGVTAADFSPDGKRMLTAALDNTAKIWEIETGRLLANLRGHTDTLVTARYSPDGKKIVTGCEDGTAKIWDANSTLMLADLTGHTGKVYTAEFSPDGKKILTTAHDGLLKLWDSETGKLLVDMIGHTQPVYYAFFSANGKKIISASDDSTAKIWDVVTGKMLADLKGHINEVWFVDLSPDGEKAITGSRDSTARIWDVVTGEVLKDIRDHHAEVSIVHFSPDGKRFVTASDDGDVKLWNAETYSLIANIKGKNEFKINRESYYPDVARAANFTPDGKKLLTVYRDSATNIWDANTGKLILHIKRGTEYANNVFLSKDGKKISLALAYAHVEIYDMEKGNLLVDLKGKANLIQSPFLSKDGKRMLISTLSGPARLIESSTGKLIATLNCGEDDAENIWASFSPDEKKILVTSYISKTPSVYDATTGALLFELKGHTKWAYGNFNSDSKRITTFSQDSTARIWDASNGKMILILKGNHPNAFFGIRYSIDRKKIFSFSQTDGIIGTWDVETGKQIAEIKAHEKFIINYELTTDGKKILTTSVDSTAKVWDVETLKLLFTIKEPGRKIQNGIFSPDGKRIFLTLSERIKGTVITKVWDTETGKYITELNQEDSNPEPWRIFFTPDGTKAFAGMGDHSVKFWDAGTGELIKNFKNLKDTINTNVNGFTPDGKQFIVTSDIGEIKFYDAETGAFVRELMGHSFKIGSLKFSPDGKKIFTSSLDNTIKIWDTETGNELLTFLTIGKDDYLVLDKYNHFDGSEGARKLLYFTCGTEVIELDQLKDQLWVPNLAERIINGEAINAAKLSDLNICKLTPVVETIEQTALQYRFQITPRLGGLSNTIIYVNGIEIKRYTPQQLTKQKEGYQLNIDKKELQKFFVAGKENSIIVKSLTAKNFISSRSVSINEKGNEKSAALPNLYAVLVGVSDYKGEELDLSFAAKDAVDIANAIDASAKKMLNTDEKEHVFIYKLHTGAGRDKFPEKNSIRQVFTEIAGKAQPNDILLVFFAGHGVMDSEKGQFYFLTADASNATVSGALKDVGISTEELSEWIKPQIMKAQKRILVFDACNSGQAIKEMLSIGQQGKNFLASRGDEKGKQIKAIEKLNERSGMFILSASASDQKAYEMGKYNQGALTYALLKAIKDQPDILEDRKYLNISRWFNAAEKSVGELARETGARQQPQIVSTTNFNIGVVDDEVRNKIILPFEKPLFGRSEFRNTELRIDNLKLRSIVEKELEELSGNSSNNSIIYNPEYDGINVFAINGDYTVTGNEITVSVILTKGGTEIKTKFEIKGKSDQPGAIAKSIANTVIEWLKNNK